LENNQRIPEKPGKKLKEEERIMEQSFTGFEGRRNKIALWKGRQEKRRGRVRK